MKLLFFFLFIFLRLPDCQAQTVIQVGNKKVIASIVDSTTFSLSGNWKIFHRDYVAETPHSYDLIPLKLLNSSVFNQLKVQGETCYGNIVKFSDSLFYPYTPYLPPLIINPFHKSHYQIIGANKYDSKYLYTRNFENKKYLVVQVYCKISQREDFSVIILNNDTIALLSDNSYTYMERFNSNKEWPVDRDSNISQELVGYSNFDIFISENYKDKIYKLNIKFELNNKNIYEHLAVLDACTNRCARVNKKTIFHVDKKLEQNIDLNKLNSNIISISGNTKSQLNRWRVKWKFTSN